jgi:flagellar biosynthesis/type III secretory pathway protein FliH
MLDGFVPLHVFLHRAAAADSACEDAGEATSPAAGAGLVDEMQVEERRGVFDALAAARRFHAALADAADAALDNLLRNIACDVLGRELALAPADVASIVAAALERYAADSPVRLRAHPDETSALGGFNLAVIADRGLRRGDVAIDVRAGTIDASLGARLEHVLDSAIEA